MVAPLVIEGGITFEGGIMFGPDVTNISFTISPADFASGESYGGGTVAQGTNGTGGFVNPGTGSLEANGYALLNPTSPASATLTAAFTAAGIAVDGSTYAWNVTWGAGSTTTSTIVRMGWDSYGLNLVMSVMNPSDPSWQNTPTGSNNVYAQSLPGTFLLPATFTPYQPLTQVGSANYWC